MTAARFEFFFAPTVENSAVRQVPITFNVTVDNFVEYPQDLDAGVPDSNPGK